MISRQQGVVALQYKHEQFFAAQNPIIQYVENITVENIPSHNRKRVLEKGRPKWK